MSKYFCNAPMHQDEVQKLAGWSQIRCTLPPGHKGEHIGKNKFATFMWWNEKENPQSKENK